MSLLNSQHVFRTISENAPDETLLGPAALAAGQQKFQQILAHITTALTDPNACSSFSQFQIDLNWGVADLNNGLIEAALDTPQKRSELLGKWKNIFALAEPPNFPATHGALKRNLELSHKEFKKALQDITWLSNDQTSALQKKFTESLSKVYWTCLGNIKDPHMRQPTPQSPKPRGGNMEIPSMAQLLKKPPEHYNPIAAVLAQGPQLPTARGAANSVGAGKTD